MKGALIWLVLILLVIVGPPAFIAYVAVKAARRRAVPLFTAYARTRGRR